MFRILAIDGGGIRGIGPAHILNQISKKIKPSFVDQIDMLAGTSTGSIIAAALACGIEPDKVVDLYSNEGKLIFSPQRPKWWKLGEQAFHSLYSRTPLEAALRSTFDEITLGEINKPLLIPATDINNGCVHVFKSAYDSEFVRDVTVPVWQAVLAACSAPTYFRPSSVDKSLLSDGGIWANNPSLAAVIDAKHRLNVSLEEVSLLSLGTGHKRFFSAARASGNWGLLTGWKGFAGFLELILSLQSQSTANYISLLLAKAQVLRIDIMPGFPIPDLDDPNNLDAFVAQADLQFTHNSAAIKKFLIS
jgi:patatin-like phospholipase/acyl hydrolase